MKTRQCSLFMSTSSISYFLVLLKFEAVLTINLSGRFAIKITSHYGSYGLLCLVIRFNSKRLIWFFIRQKLLVFKSKERCQVNSFLLFDLCDLCKFLLLIFIIKFI